MAKTFEQLFDTVIPNGGNEEKQVMWELLGEMRTLTGLDLYFSVYAAHDSDRFVYIIMANGKRLASVKKIDFEKKKITVRLCCLTSSPPLSYSGEDKLARLAGRLKSAFNCFDRKKSVYER